MSKQTSADSRSASRWNWKYAAYIAAGIEEPSKKLIHVLINYEAYTMSNESQFSREFSNNF
jgi:hypothetical protein